jgi:hypothetical protein
MRKEPSYEPASIIDRRSIAIAEVNQWVASLAGMKGGCRFIGKSGQFSTLACPARSQQTAPRGVAGSSQI